jgi:hypothetical protein
MEPGTAWAAERLPDLGVPHSGVDWPQDGPGPFDLGHEETAVVFWARGRPSRCILGEPPDLMSEELHRAIPMGYTMLTVLRKVAVVSGGEPLRTWAHDTERSQRLVDMSSYQLMMPPGNAERYLMVGVMHPFAWGLHVATALSVRTGDPVLMCQVLNHVAWH